MYVLLHISLQTSEWLRKICPSSVKLLFPVQVRNPEEELVRATDVRKVSELTASRSDKDFKRDSVALKNCSAVLAKHRSDIRKMWQQKVPAPFSPAA
ncbi:MAG: hypothetical protein ACI4NM_10440 [Bullifex sp.]